MMNKKMAGMLQNAPFKFAPENELLSFEDFGWHVVEAESLCYSCSQVPSITNVHAPAWLPQLDPRHPGSRAWSAVALHLLRRDSPPYVDRSWSRKSRSAGDSWVCKHASHARQVRA